MMENKIKNQDFINPKIIDKLQKKIDLINFECNNYISIT